MAVPSSLKLTFLQTSLAGILKGTLPSNSGKPGYTDIFQKANQAATNTSKIQKNLYSFPDDNYYEVEDLINGLLCVESVSVQ